MCYQAGLKEACEERGLRVVAYSPYGACWIAQYFPDFVPWGPASLFGDAVVEEVAKESGITPAQVLLTWCLQKGVTPIPKSLKLERVRATAKCLDSNIRLDEGQVAKLDALNDSRRNVEASIKAHARIIASPGYAWDKT